MVLTQQRSRRTPTGSRLKAYRQKRKFEIGRSPALTKFGPAKRILVRTKGGGQKAKLLVSDIANVYNPKTKKYMKSKIKTISDNIANKNYIRRNIMNKGAIIETEAGKARITSRPGQTGAINAVLI
jgi:small subunit ribosomal protein S8e